MILNHFFIGTPPSYVPHFGNLIEMNESPRGPRRKSRIMNVFLFVNEYAPLRTSSFGPMPSWKGSAPWDDSSSEGDLGGE